MDRPSPLLLIPGLGMVLVAIVATVWVLRGRPWLRRAVGLGALAWVVAVGFKFLWSLPTQGFVPVVFRELPVSIAGPALWLYVGLLTGIFECGVAWVVARRTSLADAGWREALAFGVGFGAIEAFVLGAPQVLGIGIVLLIWNLISAADQAEMASSVSLNGYALWLPILERGVAVVAHTLSCVLVVYGIRVRQARWFWLSFLYATAIDGYAAWGIQRFNITESWSRQALFELFLGLFALVGVWGCRRLQPVFPPAISTEAQPAEQNARSARGGSARREHKG